MRVLGVCENAQFAIHGSAQRILGKHALHCQLDDSLRVSLLHLLEVGCLQVTNVPGVMAVKLVLGFITSNNHFSRVDDNHVVAGINVRCVCWLVLTAQSVRAFSRDVTERLAFCIDNEPFTFDL